MEGGWMLWIITFIFTLNENPKSVKLKSKTIRLNIADIDWMIHNFRSRLQDSVFRILVVYCVVPSIFATHAQPQPPIFTKQAMK